MSAESFSDNPSWTLKGAVLEKEVLSVEVRTVPGGKVGVAAPTGPVTSRSALSGSVVGSVVCAQPPEVVAVMTVVSRPLVGLNVRLPSVPGGGAALATPLSNSDPPVATATARGAAINRVRNRFLSTILSSFCKKDDDSERRIRITHWGPRCRYLCPSQSGWSCCHSWG